MSLAAPTILIAKPRAAVGAMSFEDGELEDTDDFDDGWEAESDDDV
ncbi:MAG TPA: hypothetical protein VLU99_00495 [Nitrososphaerales archaeon]|nr:hypothetical protein [Nitrososphaerales archaeon]